MARQTSRLPPTAYDTITSLGFSPPALNRLLHWGLSPNRVSTVLRGQPLASHKLEHIRASLQELFKSTDPDTRARIIGDQSCQ